jgi:hypothetical protein
MIDASPRAVHLFLAALLVLAGLPVQAACIAQSGPHTAALVELYTSEDCTSCRPADRWLSRLGSRFSLDRVVPLALHVDYRDYVEGKDPYAQRRVSERQRRLSLLQRMALVYTPEVVLQGRQFRAWESGEFDDAVKRINDQPARARLKVEIRGFEPGALAAAVEGEVVDPAQRRDAVLYMAAFQGRPYDYVVLEWQGPFSARGTGLLAAERRLALLPGATPSMSGVAAFVQNRRTAEVLQAVLLSACSP